MSQVTEEWSKAADTIASSTSDETFGSVHVREVDAEFLDDSEGRVALFLTVTLDDPETETWPLDDVLALRHAIRNQVVRHGLPTPFYVRLRPEAEEPLAEDDDGETGDRPAVD